MTLDDPVADLANALTEAHEKVQPMVDGLGSTEEARSVEFVLSAYDLAVEMWFQKGDPAAPTLTNWERPWRKYGGDNPTTTYLSAPVSPAHCYRLRGSIGDAVYAGVQVYTKGPGYNAPSGNISDRDLVLDDGSVDLLIGGERPGDGRAWLPLIDDDYLVMVRLYHRTPEVEPPSFTIERIDDHPAARLTVAARAHTAAAFFRDEVLSTMAVTDTLRDAGVNAYPPPDAPVHRPRYTGALFPTLDNVYDGFYVDLAPGAGVETPGAGPGRPLLLVRVLRPLVQHSGLPDTPLLPDPRRDRARTRWHLRVGPRPRRPGPPQLDRHRRTVPRDLRHPLPPAREALPP